MPTWPTEVPLALRVYGSEFRVHLWCRVLGFSCTFPQGLVGRRYRGSRGTMRAYILDLSTKGCLQTPYPTPLNPKPCTVFPGYVIPGMRLSIRPSTTRSGNIVLQEALGRGGGLGLGFRVSYRPILFCGVLVLMMVRRTPKSYSNC